jgi:hypothetical protein
VCNIYRFYFAELGDYEGTGVQFGPALTVYGKEFEATPWFRRGDLFAEEGI